MATSKGIGRSFGTLTCCCLKRPRGVPHTYYPFRIVLIAAGITQGIHDDLQKTVLRLLHVQVNNLGYMRPELPSYTSPIRNSFFPVQRDRPSRSSPRGFGGAPTNPGQCSALFPVRTLLYVILGTSGGLRSKKRGRTASSISEKGSLFPSWPVLPKSGAYRQAVRF